MAPQANPAPLGLMGFGMTTFLLNIHNAGFYPVDSMIMAMGLFYGGLAQIIAGIMEFKNGNTFATTAFTSYGGWYNYSKHVFRGSFKDYVDKREWVGGP